MIRIGMAYRMGWLLGKGMALGAVLVLCVLLAGCGGGSVGTTGVLNTFDVAESVNAMGWSSYGMGNNLGAIKHFESVLDGQGTAEQKREAWIGKGYAVSRADGIRNAGKYFEKAISHQDAKVGMAGYYLSLGGRTNVNKAIGLMEAIHMNNVDKVYRPEYNTGVTDAEAHALMGILYYMAGRRNDARRHLIKAESLILPGELDLVSMATVMTITSELL